MRIQTKLALASLTVIAALSVSAARAQYRAVGDDGIAASPKVRQVLNAYSGSATKTPAPVMVACCSAPVRQELPAPGPCCGNCQDRKPQATQPAPKK
jgi:hypothetical protein